MSNNRYGTRRFVHGVIARWPGGAAVIQSYSLKTSLAINDKIDDEKGRPLEELFDVEVSEASVEAGIPEGMTEPLVGELVTLTIANNTNSGTTTKAFVCISKDRPEKQSQYLKMNFTLRNMEYVDYTVSSSE
jgi:hypothetical protein